jgi:hypothetical protein
MKGFRLPQRDLTWSENAPIKIVVRVAVIALAATIQEIGRGSGVILSYMKVLKYWFSTPQANWPAKPNKMSESQVDLDRIVGVSFVLASVIFFSRIEDRKLGGYRMV